MNLPATELNFTIIHKNSKNTEFTLLYKYTHHYNLYFLKINYFRGNNKQSFTSATPDVILATTQVNNVTNMSIRNVKFQQYDAVTTLIMDIHEFYYMDEHCLYP